MNYGIRILAYHRVSSDDDELAVTPRRFRKQMEYLANARYRVVGVSEAVGALDSHPPTKVIGLTFDDGYADLMDNALPVLAEHDFTATIFLTTGVTDGRHTFPWYDRMPPLLDWTAIVNLDQTGAVDFGAHTVTHANLLALDDVDAVDEIARSKRELEDRLGHSVDVFCYPAGLFGNRERCLVRASGFRIAVGMEPGVNQPSSDVFALRRTAIGARDWMLDFRAKVDGGHDRPPPMRSVYRRLRFGSPPAKHL